jgi:hypothetical protein
MPNMRRDDGKPDSVFSYVSPEQPHPAVFTRNRDRLLNQQIARGFVGLVVGMPAPDLAVRRDDSPQHQDVAHGVVLAAYLTVTGTRGMSARLLQRQLGAAAL